MLDSIYVGLTGLMGFSKGLRVIANNTANINTPGYKGSNLQFEDLFYSNHNLAGGAGGQSFGQLGYGLNTAGTTLSFKQGDFRNTAEDLDVAVDGTGMFVLKDADGQISYTRAGQFVFNDTGVLVSKSNGDKVLALSGGNSLSEISIANLRTNAGTATTTVNFSGSLISASTTASVSGVNVVDTAGVSHTLTLNFSQAAANSGTWTVDVLDGGTAVGLPGTIAYVGSSPVPGSSTVTVNYAPAGSAPFPITFDFSTGVTFLASGPSSTLAMSSQNGVATGSLTKTSFDAGGVLTLTYSNGRVIKGATLALIGFNSQDAVAAFGNNQFRAVDPSALTLGVALQGAFGRVQAGVIEASNVDLAQEFSDLVVMQRGYQSSSQVISTANEMLQQLFSMKSK